LYHNGGVTVPAIDNIVVLGEGMREPVEEGFVVLLLEKAEAHVKGKPGEFVAKPEHGASFKGE
jgi:hypothetical protein